MNFKTKLIASIVIATFLIAVSTPVITLAQEYKQYVVVLTHPENDEYLEPYDVAFDSQGNTYIITEGYNYDEDVCEYYVVKLDPKGQVLWAKRISGNYVYIYIIAYDEYSNKVFVAGEYYATDSYRFIARLNADNGDFEKAILIPIDAVTHWLTTIVPDGKGNVYVTEKLSYQDSSGTYVLKFDTNLNYKWGKGLIGNSTVNFDIADNEFVKPLAVDSEGNVYVGIRFTKETGGYHHLFSLMKISSDGEVAKAVIYDSSNPELKASGDYIYTIKVKDDGEVFFTTEASLYNVTSRRTQYKMWGIVKVDSELNMENFYVYRIPDWGMNDLLYMYSFDIYGDELYFAANHWDHTNDNDNLTIYSINPNTGEIHGAVVVESAALPSVGYASYVYDWNYLRLRTINGKLYVGSYLYLYNDYYYECGEALVFTTDFDLTSEEVVWDDGNGSFPLSFKRYGMNDLSVQMEDYSAYFKEVDINYLITSLNESGAPPLYIEPLSTMPFTDAYEEEHFLVTRGHYGLLPPQPKPKDRWEAIQNVINAENDILEWLNNEVNMSKYSVNGILRVMRENNMTKDNYKEFIGEAGESGEIAETLNTLEKVRSKLYGEALISRDIPKISSEAVQKLIELYGQYLENYPTVSGRLQLLYAMFLGE